MSRVAYVLLFAETRDHRIITRDAVEFLPADILPILTIGMDRRCVGAARGFVKGEHGIVAEIVFDEHDLGDVPLYPAPDLGGGYIAEVIPSGLHLFTRCQLAAISLVEFDYRPWENVQPLYVPQTWSGYDAAGGSPDPQRYSRR